jgi:hypothetical protein
MREATVLSRPQELLLRLLARAHSRNLQSAWHLRTVHAYTWDRLGLPKSTVNCWVHIQYRLSPCFDKEWRLAV